MKRFIGISIMLSAFGLLMADNLSLVYQDPNIKELRGVFAFSDGKVWAVGTDGAVRRSTDHGETWQTVNISGATDYHLNAVFFASASVGCIVGEKKADPDRFKGIIYRTTNGGTTWAAVPSGNYIAEKYVPFKDVVFQIREYGNPNWGYIAAGEGWIYQTTNGGANWTREKVDNTSKHCFTSVAFDLYNTNTIYAVADAGHETGLIAYNSGGGWVIEYPFSNLGLNFFGVSALLNDPNIAASKGYRVYKNYGQWYSTHTYPDQNVFYDIAAVCEFTSNYMSCGSDEAIIDDDGNTLNHLYGKYIKGVSLTHFAGYPGPSMLSNYTFFVGKDGRIFKYDHSYDPWPPGFTEVSGQYQYVRCKIFDSEEPSYAYIYRATIPEGPYVLIAQFDIPTGQTYTWNDNSVDFNIPYYYKVSGNGQVPNTPPWSATPSGLGQPSYPSPVPWFTTADHPNDDGAITDNEWGSTLPEYVLYRDGKPIYVGYNTSYTDNSAITGKNHEYKVRCRSIVKETDYIYSQPVAYSCTPVNNIAPSTPTNLTGEKVSGGFKMRWNEPNNVDIHGYNIYRKINVGGNYTRVNSVPCPRPFWYDTPPAYQKIWYKVSAVDWAGNEGGYSNEIYFDALSQPDGATQGTEATLTTTGLGKIMPNPSTEKTLIQFSLARDGIVWLTLYDATGRIVKKLTADNFSAGNHTITLDLKSDERLNNGVYFIQMKTDDYQAMEKLIIRR